MHSAVEGGWKVHKHLVLVLGMRQGFSNLGEGLELSRRQGAAIWLLYGPWSLAGTARKNFAAVM